MRASFRAIVLAGTAVAAACSATGGAPDFTLRNDTGVAWSLSQQRGTAILLTFGFTHCADTCPTTVAKLARLAQSYRQPDRPIEVVLVTVDPKRDTVAAMHRFVDQFEQAGTRDVVGLTGTPAEIERVKAAYHIWSQPMPHGAIAHTAAIVLIDPRGRLSGVADDDDSKASLSRALSAMLAS